MIWMDLLIMMMFGEMFVMLFSGYPVAFVLGGVAMGFAGIGKIGRE